MGAFRTVIGCNMDQYKTGSFEPTRYLVLDTQEEKTVRSTATIATQPLQSGDTMSDHMYRDPNAFTIRGMFSLNGKNWDDDSYDFMEKGDRLTNVQHVFEAIKDNGILCRITTIDEDDFASVGKQGGASSLKSDARTRYKTRDNMALTSILWEERQNTVKYTFEFREVIMVESQEYEELSEEEREELGLPKVTSPVGSSLGTVLADTGQLTQVILRTLYDNGYINDDWFTLVCEGYGEIIKDMVIASAVVAVGLAVAVITAVPAAIAAAAAPAGMTLAALAGSVSILFPVGTVILAVGAVIAGFAIGISNFLKWKEKKKKQTLAFKLVNGKPDADWERMQNLLDDIKVAVNQAKSNLTIYSISGNKEQVVVLNIGGEYYQISFSKNNATDGQEWGAKVTDLDNDPVSGIRHAWCPVSSFNDLNRNQNLWFRDKTGQFEVYLVNPSLSAEINKTDEEMEAAKANLEGYSIWVSKGDITQQVDKVEKAIEKAIEAEGFV